VVNVPKATHSAHAENDQARVPWIGNTVSERVKTMKYLSIVIMVARLSLPVRAQQKEARRVQNAGMVMKEILNVPDDIPKQLLNKAECVIVLPSVVKFEMQSMSEKDFECFARTGVKSHPLISDPTIKG
jgi:hypothetical protein